MKFHLLPKLTVAMTPVIASLLFSSCGGPIAPVAAPVPPASSSADMPWNQPLSTAADSTSRSPQAKQRTSRPGLGTGWGNQVNSHIHYTSFTRASSKPAGIASIYYNDKEGVDAMAGKWKYTGKGMQQAAGGLVEWGVKSGRTTLKNYHSGSRRYVVGNKGANYTLVIKNICYSRLEVVLSVDGLDVMDGRNASFKKRGYIIRPGKTLIVKGFRTSESAVAAFKFSSVSRSYSNQLHGKTRNVGVIGMAVFTQKGVDPWKWSRKAVKQRHSASPFAEAPTSYRAR